MKWARVGKAYFNPDLIQAFYWSSGSLVIYWLGDPEAPETLKDPDRRGYNSLCRALGVRPVEVDDSGKG